MKNVLVAAAVLLFGTASISSAQEPPPQLRMYTYAQYRVLQVQAQQAARRAHVAERGLLAIITQLGFPNNECNTNGVPRIQCIVDRVDALAAQLHSLIEEIAALRRIAIPDVAQLLTRAMERVNAGDLAGATSLYREAENLGDAHEAQVHAQDALIQALRGLHQDAAAQYARAAAIAPPTDISGRLVYLQAQAVELRKAADISGDQTAFQAVVQLYDEVIIPLSRQASPDEQASVQNDLGSALVLMGESGDADSAIRAVAVLAQALQTRTRQHDPTAWGVSSNNLGNALLTLYELQGDGQLLTRAIHAFEDALTVRTREVDAVEWAKTQINLGNAYADLGERGDTSALRQSIDAYRMAASALGPPCPSGCPNAVLWAQAQTNLGASLIRLGERGDAQSIRDGVQALEMSLRVLTRESYPNYWAQIKNNIGVALGNLGDRVDSARLPDAISALNDALSVLTPDHDLARWADVQMNLGLIWRYAGEQHEDREALSRSVQIEEGVRSRLDPTQNRTQWLHATRYLADTLVRVGGLGDRKALDRSITLYQQVLAATEPSLDLRVSAQTGLANAYRLLATQGDTQSLNGALDIVEHIDATRTREQDPVGWAANQFLIGEILDLRADSICTRGTHCNDAVAAYTHYQAALQVWTARDFSRAFQRAQAAIAALRSKYPMQQN